MVFVPGLFLVALGLGCHSVYENDVLLPSSVLRVKGSARYSRPGGTNWITLKKGALLETGAVVQTAGDSLVDVALGERRWGNYQEQAGLRGERTYVWQPNHLTSVLRVDSDSVVRFEHVARKGGSVKTQQMEARFTLLTGRVFCAVGHVDCEIRLTNNVVRAQNALFSVTSYGLMAVNNGAVTVIDTKSNLTNQLKAGYEYDLRTGETHAIPDHIH